MYGMKKFDDDVVIFVTYHKEKSVDNNAYVSGKPDYADVFEDNMIFKWESQIGKGLDSKYMNDVITTKRKHLFVMKSEAESNFNYMGQFDILTAVESTKKDNKGVDRIITKVNMRMHTPVKDDILKYLQTNIEEQRKN